MERQLNWIQNQLSCFFLLLLPYRGNFIHKRLFLKTYYPKLVLNNYSGFYSRKVYVNEVRKTGANICLPEINKSFYKTVIYGNDIYLGFDGILNLEIGLAQLIVSERKKQLGLHQSREFRNPDGHRSETICNTDLLRFFQRI